MKQQIFCTFNIYTISYLAALRTEFDIILTYKTFLGLKKVPFIFSNVTMTFIFANILKRRICCGLLILVFIAIQAKYPPSVYCFPIQMSESSTMNVSHYVQQLNNSSMTVNKEIIFLLLLLFVRLTEDSDIKLDAAIRMLMAAL